MKIPFYPIIYIIFFGFNQCKGDPCLINIDCDECLPEFLPIVLSHGTRTNVIRINDGETVQLHCNHGKFWAFPNQSTIELSCDNGYFRTLSESITPLHISELGCDIDAYEDAIHEVEYCRNPYEGRSYHYRNQSTHHVKHLAEVCYDNLRGRTIFIHMNISHGNNLIKHNHIDREGRMSLLGSFNKMFDRANILEAEKIYDSSNSLSKKIEYMMGVNRFNFATHHLVSIKLVPSSFFFNQNGKVSKFVSNKIALWNSVANGNFRNIQNDIITSFKKHEQDSTKYVEVYVGTHDTLSLPVFGKYFELNLKPGRKYPVPKYIWTMVFNKNEHKAVVLVMYNNPFTSISEIKNSVFCPSVCNKLNWINHLRQDNNYERSIYGLVFCCDAHSFLRHINDAPNIVSNVYDGERGILKDDF